MSDPYVQYLADRIRQLEQRLELVELARDRAEHRLADVVAAHQGCTAATCTTIAAIEEDA